MTSRLQILAAIGLLAAGPAFANGDPAKGEREFRACAACHQLEAGKITVGPSLHGLIGATAGQVDGFKYSDAMIASGIVWTPETLDAFLADPKGVVDGTNMGYRGLRSDEKRADLIAYLVEATSVE